MARQTAYYPARAHVPGFYRRADDKTVLQQIRAVTNSRATYGYRRVWAMVNRIFRAGLQPQAHSTCHADARAEAPAAAAPGSFAQPRTFFYDLPGGLEDLDLHLLLAEQSLKFADTLMGLTQRAGGDHILVRGDGRLRAGLEPALPLGWTSNSRDTSGSVFSPSGAAGRRPA